MATRAQTLLLGAVAYDPKVVTIWEGFREYLAGVGLPFDFVLYSSYERQVKAHFAGAHHVSWNSPLAWVETRRIAGARKQEASAILMRDTDRDLKSVVLVRADNAIKTPADLKGKTIAVGAEDSPQATLIPLHHMACEGLALSSANIKRHDLLLGKHGDHIGGERDAARALAAGQAEAACILDANYLLFNPRDHLSRAV
jgi:ABC-type phosphate/phosphonate transport system substrate-binding protein